MSASQPLFHLQTIEAQLESERAALHSIEQQLKNSPEVVKAERDLEQFTSEMDANRKQLRATEREAEDASQKVKKLTSQLYGGGIHDSREMGLLQHEIDHAKASQSTLEDEEIRLMEVVENGESELLKLQAALTDAREKREERLPGLQGQLEAIKEALGQSEREREIAASAIPPDQLLMYERLRDRIGHAVSEVAGGICQSCRVQLPSKDVQHARGDSLVRCMNCGRILFAAE